MVEGTRFDLTAPGVRVLICGTGTHISGSRLTDVAAVVESVKAVQRTLIECCGVQVDQIRSVINPDSPKALYDTIAEMCGDADTVFLLYFIGHGLLGTDKQFYLATKSTCQPTPSSPYEALPFADVRRLLQLRCRADTVVTILDACRSAAAPEWLRPHDAFEAAAESGMYLLAAAARDDVALAPPGSSRTLFTAELIAFLTDGDPEAGRWLTLEHLYRYLHKRLPNPPQRKTTGRGGELRLAQNPAYVAPSVSMPSPNGQADDSTEQSPYLGLRWYSQDDADRFFGREELTKRLLGRVATRVLDRCPQIVLGPSGSGKSSVIRAGLVSALRSGATIEGSSSWRVLLLTPGAHPLTALAEKLADASKESARSVEQRLRQMPSSCADIGQEIVAQQDPSRTGRMRLVLIVDQFEETLTLCKDPAERRLFIDALCSVSAEPAWAFLCLGLRADFVAPFIEYPRLAAAIDAQGGALVVPPMTADELRRVITEPAVGAELEFDDGLVEHILRDLGIDGRNRRVSGELPLLSHALAQTWRRRVGRRLTFTAYIETGTIRGAIATTANELFESMDTVTRIGCQLLMMRLVTVGIDAPDTRRPLPIDDIPQIHQWASSAADLFIRSRLVSADEHVMVITHEALIDHWPLMVEWIKDKRDFGAVRQIIEDAAREWLDKGRHRDFLRAGSRYAPLREWAGTREHAAELLDHERDFLAACERNERRRSNRIRQVIGLLMVLVMVATLATIYAFDQADSAEQARDDAVSRLAAFKSEQLRARDPALAQQIALAGYQFSQTPEARSALLDSTAIPTPRRWPLAGAQDYETFGLFGRTSVASDGSLMAAAVDSPDGRTTVKLLDLRRPRDGRSMTFDIARCTALAIRPGTTQIALASDDRITLYDITRPDAPSESMPSVALPPNADIDQLRWAPDGKELTANASHRVLRWQVGVGDELTPMASIDDLPSYPAAIAYSPDGGMLAVSAGMTVRLFSRRNGSATDVQLDLGHAWWVSDLSFNSVSDTLAAATGAGVVLMDVTDRSNPREKNRFGGAARTVSFNRTGTYIAAASQTDERHVDIYLTANGQRHARLPQPGITGAVNFRTSDRGETLIAPFTGAAGPMVNEWPVPGPLVDGPVTWMDADSERNAVTVVANSDGSAVLRSYDVSAPDATTERHRPLNLPESIDALAVSNSGSIAAVATPDPPTVTLWDMSDTGVPRQRGPRIDARATGLAFTPDATRLIGTDVNSVYVLDLAAPDHPSVIATRDINGAHARHISISPDGRTAAIGTESGLLLWNIAAPNNSPLVQTRIDGDNIQFSPVSPILVAVGAGSSMAQLLDLNDPDSPVPLGRPFDLGAMAKSLSFSHTGTRLAVASGDGIRIWDVSNPRAPTRYATLGQSLGNYRAVAYGARITGTGPGELRSWVADPDSIVRALCADSASLLTPEEWSEYLPSAPHHDICP